MLESRNNRVDAAGAARLCESWPEIGTGRVNEPAMTDSYPDIEPYASGMLAVGDGNLVFWETCGDPRGKPAVVFHGGPGSGCAPWFRRLFDLSVYRIPAAAERLPST